MDGGGDVGDFDIGELWSDGEGDELGPRPTHDGGMDTMSMEQLGLKAQDVPGDGNCLLHAFAQAQRRTSHAAKATPTQVLREQLGAAAAGATVAAAASLHSRPECSLLSERSLELLLAPPRGHTACSLHREHTKRHTDACINSRECFHHAVVCSV